MPIQINPLTVSLYHRIYARILVEVDMALPLPVTILITRREVEIFVQVEYKAMLKYCHTCGIIGHEVRNGRRSVEGNKDFEVQHTFREVNHKINARTVQAEQHNQPTVQ